MENLQVNFLKDCCFSGLNPLFFNVKLNWQAIISENLEKNLRAKHPVSCGSYPAPNIFSVSSPRPDLVSEDLIFISVLF